MTYRVAIALFTAALATAPLQARKGRDYSVGLKFTSQEAVHSESPDVAPNALEQPLAIRVVDGRAESAANVIGEGTDDDDKAFPISADGDVRKFIEDTVRVIATEWGVKTAESADRVLTIRVTRFFVEEGNKAVGSVYGSEVKFGYTLTDKSGRKLAEGANSGTAHRFGRARSAENCNEVLSDALKEAFANVLGTEKLQTSWASGKPSTITDAKAEPKESAEERLRKLDELLKKGHITKEEHAKKRAEILKDL